MEKIVYLSAHPKYVRPIPRLLRSIRSRDHSKLQIELDELIRGAWLRTWTRTKDKWTRINQIRLAIRFEFIHRRARILYWTELKMMPNVGRLLHTLEANWIRILQHVTHLSTIDWRRWKLLESIPRITSARICAFSPCRVNPVRQELQRQREREKLEFFVRRSRLGQSTIFQTAVS